MYVARPAYQGIFYDTYVQKLCKRFVPPCGIHRKYEIISDVDLPRLKCKSKRINYINRTLTLSTNNVGECKIDTL